MLSFISSSLIVFDSSVTLSSGAGWDRSQIPSLSVSTYLAQSPGYSSLTLSNGQSSHAYAVVLNRLKARIEIIISFLIICVLVIVSSIIYYFKIKSFFQKSPLFQMDFFDCY